MSAWGAGESWESLPWTAPMALIPHDSFVIRENGRKVEETSADCFLQVPISL